MITLQSSGSFKASFKFFERILDGAHLSLLDKYGREGVEALRAATPVDTGLTAESWFYKIVKTKESTSIVWSNTNVVNGVNIAIILQYGHATGNGGYVQGRDYINPALQPIFDEIANNVWKEVTR